MPLLAIPHDEGGYREKYTTEHPGVEMKRAVRYSVVSLTKEAQSKGFLEVCKRIHKRRDDLIGI